MRPEKSLPGWLARAKDEPARGPRAWGIRFLRIGWLTAWKFHRDFCLQRAAGLAFTTIISLIPLSVLFFSFAGSLGVGERISGYVKAKIFPLVAPDFQQQMSEWLDQYISTSAFSAGSGGVVNLAAIIGLIIAALGVMVTAERYINIIWHVESHRTFLQKLATFWVILTVSPFFLLLSIYVGELVVPKGGFIERLVEEHWTAQAIYGFLVPVSIGFLGFTAMYVALPATNVRIRSAAIGGFFAALLWEACRRAFFVYVARAAMITSFYPKLASLPLFLIWIYVNWLIVLLGSVVVYVHQHLRSLLRRRHLSPHIAHSRALMGLSLLRGIATAFASGKQGPTIEEVANGIGVGAEAVRPIAHLLVERGWLAEDARDPHRYLLAKAPDRIPIREIATLLVDSEFPAEAPGAVNPGAPSAAEVEVRNAWHAFIDSFDGATLAGKVTPAP